MSITHSNLFTEGDAIATLFAEFPEVSPASGFTNDVMTEPPAQLAAAHLRVFGYPFDAEDTLPLDESVSALVAAGDFATAGVTLAGALGCFSLPDTITECLRWGLESAALTSAHDAVSPTAVSDDSDGGVEVLATGLYEHEIPANATEHGFDLWLAVDRLARLVGYQTLAEDGSYPTPTMDEREDAVMQYARAWFNTWATMELTVGAMTFILPAEDLTLSNYYVFRHGATARYALVVEYDDSAHCLLSVNCSLNKMRSCVMAALRADAMAHIRSLGFSWNAPCVMRWFPQGLADGWDVCIGNCVHNWPFQLRACDVGLPEDVDECCVRRTNVD